MKTKDTCKNIIKIPIMVPIAIGIITAIICAGILGTQLITKAAKYNVANALITEDGKFEYTELEDGTIEISKYVGTDAEVTIPSMIDNKCVTSIGDLSFYGCSSITEIIIPKGVISIGRNVFTRCNNLTTIEIPEGIKNIKEYVFYGCTSLAEINIPNTVVSIGWQAFQECKSLTEIVIPSSVRKIETDVFSGCSNLMSISVEQDNINYCDEEGVLYTKNKTTIMKYPAAKKETEYIIPNEVTRIERSSFKGCENLISIILPEEVTAIGDSAFSYCKNLESIEIPSTVSKIEQAVFTASNGESFKNNTIFNGCTNLTNINVDLNNQHYASENGVLLNKEKTKIIKYPEGKESKEYRCPEEIINIENEAFKNCKNLVTIEISEKISTIGYAAFSGCTNLKNINTTIVSGKIEQSTFANCESLTEIIITEEVTTIGENAFLGCSNLTILCFEETVAEKYAQENKIIYEILYFKSSKLEIDDETLNIKGIKHKITIEEIKTCIETNLSYTIVNLDGKTIEDNLALVGTGYEIKLKTGRNYKIIVNGDTNGDGEADFKDLVKINSHRLNKNLLEGENLLASDVNEDGVTDFKDMVKVNKFRLHKITEL